MRPRAPAGALSAQPARARDGAAWLYQHRDRRVRRGGEHSQELRLAFRTASPGLLWCDCTIRKPSCWCAGSIPLQLRHAIRNCRWLPVPASPDSELRNTVSPLATASGLSAFSGMPTPALKPPRQNPRKPGFSAPVTYEKHEVGKLTGAALETVERKSLVAIARWSTLAVSAAIARWLHPVTRFVHIENGGCVSGAPRRRACRGAPPTRARAASPLVWRRLDLLRAQQRVEGKRLLTAAAGAG